MTAASSQAFLAGIALMILGILGGCLAILPVPTVNSTLLGMIVGALAGALTVGGTSKTTDKPAPPAPDLTPPTQGTPP